MRGSNNLTIRFVHIYALSIIYVDTRRRPRLLFAMMNSDHVNDTPTQSGMAAHLKHRANWIRLSAMTMTHHARLGHTGGDLSSADILSVLYLGGVLKLDPTRPQWPERDRFILSKGHCSGAFYSALAARGFFPLAQLKTFMDPLSMLNGHPDRNKLPGVEANTGPLGHGLPIAVGGCQHR